MPSVVAKRPKIPAGILGRGANIHRQIPHEGGREGSEETPQNFHPGRMGLASGKGSGQTDPGERGGLRNGGGTAEMADARHARKRSLCISNLRIMEQKTCNDANKPSRSPSSADSRARSLPARRQPSDSGSQKNRLKSWEFPERFVYLHSDLPSHV